MTDTWKPRASPFCALVSKSAPLVFFSCFVARPPAAVGFVSEDEYLEIQGITREQSGDYECSASNDVAAPVVRRVKVTVNCEWSPEPPVWPRGRPMAWPRNAPDYRASCRLRVRDNGVALSVLCF